MWKTIWRSLLIPTFILILSMQLAEGQSTANMQMLKPYLKEIRINGLDWQLMKFNMQWHEALKMEVGYLGSYVAIFREEDGRFFFPISVANKRRYNDDEPFMSMPKWKQKGVMQNAIDYLIQLLEIYFPEVKNNHQLIKVEFWYTEANVKSTIAKYENGSLIVSE
jgi:hypothetical protein